MAVTVAALTIYDMCKSSDKTMTIEQVALWEKSGGRSGPWRRAAGDDEASGLAAILGSGNEQRVGDPCLAREPIVLAKQIAAHSAARRRVEERRVQ